MAELPRKTLGRTGEEVTTLGFGAMELRGDHIHTAENIRHGVENSLRLLETDHLDLVQFHRSLTKEEFEQEGALQELLKLRDEGKVRLVGVSGTLPNLTEQIEMGVFDAFQIPYSALQREHEEVIATALEHGAGTIIRGGRLSATRVCRRPFD